MFASVMQVKRLTSNVQFVGYCWCMTEQIPLGLGSIPVPSSDGSDPIAPIQDWWRGAAAALAPALGDPHGETTWVPTFSNFTSTSAVTYASYAQVMNLVFWSLSIELGPSSVMTGTFGFSPPVPVANGAWTALGSGYCWDTSNSTRVVSVVRASTQNLVYVWTDSGGVSQAVPFTWAQGDRISLSGFYFRAP